MTAVQTRAKTLTSSLSCNDCPFKGEDLGRDRFVCNHFNNVVQSNWKATLDCFDAIEAHELGGDPDNDNRGSGRLKRLLTMLMQDYKYVVKPGDVLGLAEFELGLRDGILRKERIDTFNEDSPYYEGYAIGLQY